MLKSVFHFLASGSSNTHMCQFNAFFCWDKVNPCGRLPICVRLSRLWESRLTIASKHQLVIVRTLLIMRGLMRFLVIFPILTSSFGEECNQNGLCLGHLIEVQESVDNENEFNTITDCVRKCRSVSGCQFASFNSNYKTCTMSRACSKIRLQAFSCFM